jgi:hypothetical protein
MHLELGDTPGSSRLCQEDRNPIDERRTTRHKRYDGFHKMLSRAFNTPSIRACLAVCDDMDNSNVVQKRGLGLRVLCLGCNHIGLGLNLRCVEGAED